jgi:hypothetical protein
MQGLLQKVHVLLAIGKSPPCGVRGGGWLVPRLDHSTARFKVAHRVILLSRRVPHRLAANLAVFHIDLAPFTDVSNTIDICSQQ